MNKKEKKKSLFDTTSNVSTKTKEKIKRKVILYGIVIVVLFSGIVGFSQFQKWQKAHATKFAIGDTSITTMEYDFYYQTSLNNFLSSYGSYASAFGLDTNKPLDQQKYNEQMTWEEYFQKQAVEMIQEVNILKSEAEKDKFEYDTDKEFKEFIEQIENQAKSNNQSLKEYLKVLYGNYATESSIEPIMKDYMYSQSYSNKKIEGYKISKDEVEKYYKDNKNQFDYIDYRMITVSADYKEDASDDEINKAMADAKVKANEIYEKIYDEESFLNRDKELNGSKDESYDSDSNTLQKKVGYNDCADSVRQWLYDDSRKEGSTAIIEDTSEHSYKIIYFLKRYRDETPTASVRHILIQPEKGEDEQTYSDSAWEKAKTEADKIYKEYLDGEKTEDAFEKLAIKYSKDTGSIAKGGLYEDVEKGTMVDAFDSWLFEKNHKVGDTEIIKSEYGYHIMYYVNTGEQSWINSVQKKISQDEFNSWLNGLKSNDSFKINNSKNKLTYIKE